MIKAVEEVERGSLNSGGLESMDIIVLDSKVEVIIEDEEVWGVQDGRKGMSLPRRI